MALNTVGLGMVVRADVHGGNALKAFGVDFASLEQRLGKSALRANLKQLGLGIGLMTAGVVGMKGAFAAAGAAGDFEQKLAGVAAVTRATPKELEALRTAAIDAGIATQFSPQEAVEGLLSLATAGQTSEEAIKTLIPALDLAAGSLGQLNPEAASAAIIGTLNAYGWGAERAGEVTDKLLRVTQLTNFTARDFAAGLDKAAAAGAVFGQEFNDVLVVMGLLRNRNIDASSSATSLREATRRVGSDFGAQKAVMEAGVKIFDDQTGKMRQIVDIIQDLSDATATMTDEQRNSIVVRALGARGLLTFNAIAKAQFKTMKDGKLVTMEGREAIAAMREEMTKTAGTAADFREKLLDTFQGQKTILQGVMQTFAVVTGEGFAQFFKPIVGAFQNVMTVITKGIGNMSPKLKGLIAAIVVIGSAVMTGVGAWLSLSAVLAIFGTTIGAALAAVVTVAAPVLAIVAAVAAAIGLVVIAWQNNLGGIRDTWNSLFSAMGDALGGLFGSISALWEQAKPALTAFVGMLATGVGATLSLIGKIIKATWVPTIKVLGIVVRAIAAVAEKFHLASIAVGFFGFVGEVVSTIFGALGEIVDWIAGKIDLVVGGIQAAADWLGLGGTSTDAVVKKVIEKTVQEPAAASAPKPSTATIGGFSDNKSFVMPASAMPAGFEIPETPAGAAEAPTGEEAEALFAASPEETPAFAALQAGALAQPAQAFQPGAGEWEIVITEPVTLVLDGKELARTTAKLKGRMRRREEFASAVDEEAAD